MSAKESSEVFGKIYGLLIVLGLLWAAPLYANGVSVSAGGPYEGKVGEEIELDASLSYMLDGSEVGGYYWDWDKDGEWDECFGGPYATHTWHSAFSGKVRLYLFYPGGVDWADAQVKITGPETALSVTASSNVELSLEDERGRHIGINEDTGLFDVEIAGATLVLVPPATASDPEAEEIPLSAWAMQYNVPLVHGSTYDLTLTGVEAGPFEVCIQGLEDGTCVAEQTYQDTISEGEKMRLEVAACCNDGSLNVACNGLIYCPEMKVDPDDEIEIFVQPGGRYDTTITISETEGLRPLCSVAMTCSELTGNIDSIPISNIQFTPSTFSVPASSTQEVLLTIEVPDTFFGPVTGTVTVECAGDLRREIELIVRRGEFHGPIIQVVSPVYGIAGIPVEFDASGSQDLDGTIETYCWDWNLTGEYECFEGPVCEHTWDSAFTGVVHLRVVDNHGVAAQQYVQIVITE
jgi:hypothetical protein